jgi:protease IV
MKLGFINEVLRGVWLLDESVHETYRRLAFDFLQNQNSERQAAVSREGMVSMDTIVAFGIDSGNSYRMADSMPKERFVGVVPIQGVVAKNSYCGTMGTMNMQRLMAMNDHTPDCIGHILDIDSPGGSGSNTETFARSIRYNISKPTVGYARGMCGSAAYYIACGADELYASQIDDLVGSIGAYAVFMNYDKAMALEGVVQHVINSTFSSQKNAVFAQARSGNYTAFQTEILDPMCAQFLQTVKEMRPNLTDKGAFEGKLYVAGNAPEGMIDGIITWEKAIERVAELAKVA